MRRNLGRVLIIAGSDSSGGAGLQADVKTVTMLGGHAATAVTAITVQDTVGVHSILHIPSAVVRAQGLAVLDDIGADAVKIGMLGGPDLVEVAAELIERAGDAPAVVDPVITAKGGATLASDATVRALYERLLPLEALLRAGARAVLVKGGHLNGPRVIDVLMTSTGETRFEAARIDSRHTHGTGCTLASAVACHLARGSSLEAAVERARDYVRGAIAHAPGLGTGHGPLNHGWLLGRSGAATDFEGMT